MLYEEEKYIPKDEMDLVNKMKERNFKGEIFLENAWIHWKIHKNILIGILFKNQDDEAYIIFPDGAHEHVTHEELWEYLDSLNTSGGVLVIKKGIFGTTKKIYFDKNIKLPNGEKIYF